MKGNLPIINGGDYPTKPHITVVILKKLALADHPEAFQLKEFGTENMVVTQT